MASERKIDRDAFLKLLADNVPEVTETFSDIDDGLLHLEVATFRRCAESAADSGRLWDFERYLRFLDGILPQADDALDNALGISFIEDFALDCNDARRVAVRDRAPKRIRDMMVKINPSWATPKRF